MGFTKLHASKTNITISYITINFQIDWAYSYLSLRTFPWSEVITNIIELVIVLMIELTIEFHLSKQIQPLFTNVSGHNHLLATTLSDTFISLYRCLFSKLSSELTFCTSSKLHDTKHIMIFFNAKFPKLVTNLYKDDCKGNHHYKYISTRYN